MCNNYFDEWIIYIIEFNVCMGCKCKIGFIDFSLYYLFVYIIDLVNCFELIKVVYKYLVI